MKLAVVARRDGTRSGCKSMQPGVAAGRVVPRGGQRVRRHFGHAPWLTVATTPRAAGCRGRSRSQARQGGKISGQITPATAEVCQTRPEWVVVELSGIEPLTSSLRTRRSPN